MRQYYLQKAWEKKRNNRPWDMALLDYYRNCHYPGRINPE
jgi:hypothetical protein